MTRQFVQTVLDRIRVPLIESRDANGIHDACIGWKFWTGMVSVEEEKWAGRSSQFLFLGRKLSGPAVASIRSLSDTWALLMLGLAQIKDGRPRPRRLRKGPCRDPLRSMFERAGACVCHRVREFPCQFGIFRSIPRLNLIFDRTPLIPSRAGSRSPLSVPGRQRAADRCRGAGPNLHPSRRKVSAPVLPSICTGIPTASVRTLVS